MTRPWTPDRRVGNTTTIKVKRNCSGCGRMLGDVIEGEMDWSQPLSDTTAECGCNWDQPPGIDDDDPTSQPRPEASAERILEFVKDFGDGRVYGHPDQHGIEPLYARDLQALALAYLATTTPVPAAARDTNRPEGHA